MLLHWQGQSETVMRVNELAKKVGVTPDTVRYYTRIGLLCPTKSLENGYKNYTPSDQKRLGFILKARHLGFAVSEIEEIINLSKTGTSPCCRAREIIHKHIDETAQKINELEQLRACMERASATWDTMPDSMPDGDSVCDLIEMWDEID